MTAPAETRVGVWAPLPRHPGVERCRVDETFTTTIMLRAGGVSAFVCYRRGDNGGVLLDLPLPLPTIAAETAAAIAAAAAETFAELAAEAAADGCRFGSGKTNGA